MRGDYPAAVLMTREDGAIRLAVRTSENMRSGRGELRDEGGEIMSDSWGIPFTPAPRSDAEMSEEQKTEVCRKLDELMQYRCVIWSFKHRKWWGPERCGYTDDLNGAGRYTAQEAADIVLDDVICNAVMLSDVVAFRKGPPQFHPYDG